MYLKNKILVVFMSTKHSKYKRFLYSLATKDLLFDLNTYEKKSMSEIFIKNPEKDVFAQILEDNELEISSDDIVVSKTSNN